MKKLMAAALAAFALAGFAGIHVPKASEDQLRLSPLEEGELAYVKNDDGTVTLYVGGQDGKPMRAVDPTAIRGSRTRELTPADYSVSASEPFVYDGKTYDMDGATGDGIVGTIIVTAKSGVEIISASAQDSATWANLGGPSMNETVEITGNAVRFSWEFKEVGGAGTPGESTVAVPCHLKVSGFTIKVKEIGDTNGSTFDSTTEGTTVTVKDSRGTYDLSDLRNQLIHFHDGNRGEDWALYGAKSDVHLDGRGLGFDSNSTYRAAMARDKTLAIVAGGRRAITVSALGGSAEDPEYTHLEFTAIEVDTSTKRAVLTFSQDITNFDRNDLKLTYCDHLENGGLRNFYAIVPGDDWYYVDDTTISVDCQPGGYDPSKGFWRLVYSSGAAENTFVSFDVAAYATAGLCIKGTDGKVYGIDVSGGTGPGTAGTVTFTQISE